MSSNECPVAIQTNTLFSNEDQLYITYYKLKYKRVLPELGYIMNKDSL